VVRLDAHIVAVRHVARGETVGYDAVWTARHAARLAVVAVGYADGFRRSLGATDQSPGAYALVAGKRCPLAGRISMDLLAVDLSELPDGIGRRGELVTLIGGEITVDALANIAGTIGYEILTSLGRRYHRIYPTA
jgi:alanine racemase